MTNDLPDPYATPPTIPAGAPRPAETPTIAGASTPADAPPLPVHARLGRYDLLEQLGRGGMGVVWKAWDSELRRIVCVKLIRAEEAGGPDALERFLREARIAARLRHPHILSVHDVGEAEGRHYLTMDLVEGKSFAQLLDRARDDKRAGRSRAHADLRDEVRILADVAEAVGYAHQNGVVHRDMKPGNVLIDREGHAYVIDFGLAKEAHIGEETKEQLRTLTVTGTAIGTPAYMSPEQAGGQTAEIGPQSDVWALGVMLYEILTGSLPYEAEDMRGLIFAVLLDEPSPPRKRNAHVPAELEAVCLKAMEKERQRRYRTAAEFAEELRRWLRGDPVEARSHGSIYRALRWAARRKRVVLPAIAAALTIAALGVWGWRTHRRSLEDVDARVAAEARSRRDTEARAHLVAGLYEKCTRAVARFEDSLKRVRMPNAARPTMAQPLIDMLDQIITEEPSFGPARSCRGRVEFFLGIEKPAQLDLNEGCARSPEFAVVWYYRGLCYVEQYSSTRSLPGFDFASGGVVFEPVAPEGSRQREWKERGLADLKKMSEVAKSDRFIGKDEARLGKAIALLSTGGEAAWKEALALLEGLAGPEASRFRGIALHHLGRFEEAARAFAIALHEWTEDGETWMEQGDAEVGWAWTVRSKGGDGRGALRAAIASYGEAITREFELSESYYDRGLCWMTLGEMEEERGVDPREDLAKGIADGTEAISRNDGCAEAWLNRGICHFDIAEWGLRRAVDSREEYRLAIADSDEAISRAPRVASGYNNRGNALMGLGQAQSRHGEDPREAYRRAIEQFEVSLKIDPSSGSGHSNLGNAYFVLGQEEDERGADPRETYRRAIAQHDEGIRLDPDLATAWYNRGCGYLDLARCEASRGVDPRESSKKAIADFGEAISRQPAYPDASGNRALAWTYVAGTEGTLGLDATESYGRAIADAQTAIDGGFVRARLTLGIACMRTGRWDEAISAFETTAKEAPDLAPQAKAYLEKTRAMQEASSEPWVLAFTAGGEAIAAGEYAKARGICEEGLRLFAVFTAEERAKRMADPAVRAALADAQYNLACIESLASTGKDGPEAVAKPIAADLAAHRRDVAFSRLAKAIDLGANDRAQLEKDADLAPLRADPRWAPLLERLGR